MADPEPCHTRFGCLSNPFAVDGVDRTVIHCSSSLQYSASRGKNVSTTLSTRCRGNSIIHMYFKTSSINQTCKSLCWGTTETTPVNPSFCYHCNTTPVIHKHKQSRIIFGSGFRNRSNIANYRVVVVLCGTFSSKTPSPISSSYKWGHVTWICKGKFHKFALSTYTSKMICAVIDVWRSRPYTV